MPLAVAEAPVRATRPAVTSEGSAVAWAPKRKPGEAVSKAAGAAAGGPAVTAEAPARATRPAGTLGRSPVALAAAEISGAAVAAAVGAGAGVPVMAAEEVGLVEALTHAALMKGGWDGPTSVGPTGALVGEEQCFSSSEPLVDSGSLGIKRDSVNAAAEDARPTGVSWPTLEGRWLEKLGEESMFF